jgi:hypothetical protein
VAAPDTWGSALGLAEELHFASDGKILIKPNCKIIKKKPDRT